MGVDSCDSFRLGFNLIFANMFLGSFPLICFKEHWTTAGQKLHLTLCKTVERSFLPPAKLGMHHLTGGCVREGGGRTGEGGGVLAPSASQTRLPCPEPRHSQEGDTDEGVWGLLLFLDKD